MGKGEKKGLNPADAFRKSIRKQEIKKNKKHQEAVKEVRGLLNDPQKIQAEIDRLQKESDENRLDKTLKDKIKELKVMKTVADKKALIRENTERLRTSFHKEQDDDDDEESATKSESAGNQAQGPRTTSSTSLNRRPEDSVYYHPLYNPSGEPPPGHPQVYKYVAGAVSADTIATSSSGDAISRFSVDPKDYASPQVIGGPPRGIPTIAAGRGSTRPVIVGGQNGIPLPPPRPAMIGGQNGIPLPPPRGVIVGGQNGIPLPPPRGVIAGGQNGIPLPPPQPGMTGFDNRHPAMFGTGGMSSFPMMMPQSFPPQYGWNTAMAMGLNPPGGAFPPPPPPPPGTQTMATTTNSGVDGNLSSPAGLHDSAAYPYGFPGIPPPPPPLTTADSNSYAYGQYGVQYAGVYTGPSSTGGGVDPQLQGAPGLPAPLGQQNNRGAKIRTLGKGAVDPLDPAASGYTKRFENPHAKRLKTSVPEVPALVLSSVTTTTSTVPSSLPNAADESSRHVAAASTDNETDDVEDAFQDLIAPPEITLKTLPENPYTIVSAEPSGEAVALAAPEPVARPVAKVEAPTVVPTSAPVVVPAIFGNFQFSLPSAEELMKRRRQVTSDVDIGVSTVTRDQSNSGNPSTEKIEINEATKPTLAPGTQQQAKSSINSLLVAYSDDSDVESDEGEKAIHSLPKTSNYARTFAPEPSLNAPIHVIPSQVSMPSIVFPSVSGALAAESQAPTYEIGRHSTDSSLSIPFPGSTTADQSIAPKKVPTAVPKIMKRDAALTAFVPNSLRIKRQSSAVPSSTSVTTVTSHHSTVQTSLSGAIAAAATSIRPMNSASRAESELSKKPALATTVEDAYSDFLAEINQLTGLE